MISFALAPDRFNRYFIASQCIRRVIEAGLSSPRILDLGSNENLLSQLLDGYPVIQTDYTRTLHPEMLVQSLAQNTPFPDRSMDIVVCLDVLEHNSENDRARILDEIERLTTHTAIIAFPINTPFNTRNEAILNDIHIALHGQTNRFLSEHQQFGLVNADKVFQAVSDSFPYRSRFASFNKNLWMMAHLIDFFTGILPHSKPIQDYFWNTLNLMPAIENEESNAYRVFIVGSHFLQPDFLAPSLKIANQKEAGKDLIAAFQKSYNSIKDLDQYARKMEQVTHELESSYHALEVEFRTISDDLEQSRKKISQSEEANRIFISQVVKSRELIEELSEQITRLTEENAHRSALEREYEKLAIHALHLDRIILEKDKLITDLQSRISSIFKDTLSQ